MPRIDRPTRSWIAFAGFAAIVIVLLGTEHRAHVLGALPYLLLLACPFMHLFMHRGHGEHDHDHHRDGRTS